MAENVDLIIQLPAGSVVDRQLAADPPASVTSCRVVIERLPADAEGKIEPPEAGQVVLSFLSPEALIREAEQLSHEVHRADTSEPPVVVVQVAEEVREDEIAVLLQAAAHAGRTLILCILGSI
jgi:hypothetical protein